jgi:hypothetical protein
MLDAMNSAPRLCEWWARRLEFRLASPLSYEFRLDAAPTAGDAVPLARQD